MYLKHWITPMMNYWARCCAGTGIRPLLVHTIDPQWTSVVWIKFHFDRWWKLLTTALPSILHKRWTHCTFLTFNTVLGLECGVSITWDCAFGVKYFVHAHIIQSFYIQYLMPLWNSNVYTNLEGMTHLLYRLPSFKSRHSYESMQVSQVSMFLTF